MIAIEQYGQNPFKWMDGLSEGPCPLIDGPFMAVLEDITVRLVCGCTGVWTIETDSWSPHSQTIQGEDLPTFFKIINFALLPNTDTHPDYEEFEAFFRKYDVVRFIP